MACLGATCVSCLAGQVPAPRRGCAGSCPKRPRGWAMVRGVIPAVAKPTREPSDVQRLDQELAGIGGRTRSSVPRASPLMRRPALVSEWTRLVPTASTGAGLWSPVPPAGWGARPPPSSQGHWWPRPTRPLAPNANSAGSQRKYPAAPKAPNTHHAIGHRHPEEITVAPNLKIG